MPSTDADRPILTSLFQFSVYDFTDVREWEVGEDGRFKDDGLEEWWADNDLRPFLIWVDGNIAGFAVIEVQKRNAPQPNTRSIEEFLVLRRYRGNDGAVRFWRTVITRYTDGQFRGVQQDNERWRGTVQSFGNSC